VNIWKENVMEDLKNSSLVFAIVGEFLTDLKQKFGVEDNEIIKIAKLKKVEQGGKTMEKFIQEFRRAARESGYKGRLLIEEFKQEMNEVIRRKLMKAEKPLRSIK